MWDRKTQPQPQTAAEPIVHPPAPVRANPPEPARRGTEIGKSISIVGEIYSEEDLFIDGEVEGTLDLNGSMLTIGPNGKAKSNVKAREVVILGEVRGDIDAAQKITIRRQGSLVGNIRTTGIVIDDEAYFKGSIDIVRKTADASSA